MTYSRSATNSKRKHSRGFRGKYPGSPQTKNSLSARAPDARREAVFCLKKKGSRKAACLRVWNAGVSLGTYAWHGWKGPRAGRGVWVTTLHLAGDPASHNTAAYEKTAGLSATAPAPEVFAVCSGCRKFSVGRALFPAHNAGQPEILHGVLNLIFIKVSFYIT